MISEGSCEKLD